MTECSIVGCEGQAKARGWCQAHYMRWRNTGDPGPALVVRRQRGRTCSVEGCDRKHQGRGFCDRHLGRFLRYGDPGPAAIEPRRPDAPCAVDGCDKTIRRGGRGWCNAHYLRWRKTGDPASPLTFGTLPDSAVTYVLVHGRLKRELGPASAHSCVACEGSARHWAYDHAAPDERVDDKTGLPFSVDLAHYQPMCRLCHRRFDVEHMQIPGCSIEDCDGEHKAKGLCSKHYQAARKGRL